MKKPEKRDMKKHGIGVLVVIAAIVAGLWVQGTLHGAAIARQNAAIATQLGNQGVTGIGTPDATLHVVPFQVGKCVVDLKITVTGKTLTLDLPYYDGTNRLIGATDTVSDAATATAVRASLTAMLKANPHNQVCK